MVDGRKSSGNTAVFCNGFSHDGFGKCVVERSHRDISHFNVILFSELSFFVSEAILWLVDLTLLSKQKI